MSDFSETLDAFHDLVYLPITNSGRAPKSALEWFLGDLTGFALFGFSSRTVSSRTNHLEASRLLGSVWSIVAPK